MTRIPRNRQYSVYGGFMPPGRKIEGYRLRVEVRGEADRIWPLKANWTIDARNEALIRLAQEEISTGIFIWAYTEYWSTQYRKWVIAEVIRTNESAK